MVLYRQQKKVSDFILHLGERTSLAEVKLGSNAEGNGFRPLWKKPLPF